eukprot:ctg_1671.g456
MDSWEESRIRQLLKDAAVSDTRAAEDFLLQLQQVLQSLPRRRLAARQLEPASKVLLAEAAAVYRVRNEEARVEFQAPEKIVIVGSFLLRTAVRDDHNVDLAVLIPPACLYEKDYRDFRYHDRRLLYLVELARALQASGKFEWLRFGELWETASERPEADPPVRKPVLFLQPRQQSFVLRVMPVIQRGQFDARKLRPERGNLRSAAPDAATPLYNRSITDDMAPMDDLLFCHEAAEKCYGFRDLVRLLKLWRNNRGLSRYDGGPELRRLRSSHYLTMQMARLVHADRIPPRATVRHALHVAFAALAAEGDRHGFALREVQAALAATESPLAAVDEAGGLLPSLFTNSVEPIGHFDMLLVLRPADAASAPSLRQEVSRMAALWEAALGDRVGMSEWCQRVSPGGPPSRRAPVRRRKSGAATLQDGRGAAGDRVGDAPAGSDGGADAHRAARVATALSAVSRRLHDAGARAGVSAAPMAQRLRPGRSVGVGGRPAIAGAVRRRVPSPATNAGRVGEFVDGPH